MKNNNNNETFEPVSKVIAEIDDRLNNLLHELIESHEEPVIGEFFLCLLDFAADLKDTLLEMNIIEINEDLSMNSIIQNVYDDFELSEEQKEINSKMN